MFPDLLRDDVFRLETRRQWLRWPRATDAALIARYLGERDVAEMTAHAPHPYPPGAAADFVLKARADNMGGNDLVLVLAPKARPTEIIGAIGLHGRGAQEATLDFWLGKPFWAQGYMSEAAHALLDMAFSLTDLAAVHAVARQGDLAARHVLEACGFHAAGSGVETAPARGGIIPVERYALSRSQRALAELTMAGRDLVPPHMQTA
jgi:RimJ/RimL family protein N-acetyltransferase